MAESTPVPVRRAGPLRRLGARVIDQLVLLVPVLAVSAALGGLDTADTDLDPGLVLVLIVTTAIEFGYFVVMESQFGQTVGKRSLGLRVLGGSGPPTVEQAMQRNAFVLLNIVPGMLGALALGGVSVAIGVSIDRDQMGRGFHDRYAGTAVDFTGGRSTDDQ